MIAPAACGSWRCSHCARLKRAIAHELIRGGISQAWARGADVAFLTLTLPPRRSSFAELSPCFATLRGRLRRRGRLDEYCAVVEGGDVRPHLHVLVAGRPIPTRLLAEQTHAAGFGRLRDVQAVRDLGVAGYMSKGLAETAVAMALQGASRSRPVRCSRGWYPGGAQRAAGVVLGHSSDTGPWDRLGPRLAQRGQA